MNEGSAKNIAIIRRQVLGLENIHNDIIAKFLSFYKNNIEKVIIKLRHSNDILGNKFKKKSGTEQIMAAPIICPCPKPILPSKYNTSDVEKQLSSKMRIAQLIMIKGTFAPENRHTANLVGSRRLVYMQ